SVVVAGETAGFRIFLHVLPEVLTELAGLFASSSIGNVIHVIAILAIHQVHQASPVPRSACERGSTKQIPIERHGAEVRLPDLSEEIAQCSRRGDARLLHGAVTSI